MRLCDVENCDRKHYAKGMCNMHYQRINFKGSLDKAKRASGEGSIDPKGYHRLTVDGKKIPAHRLVMEQALGRSLHKHENVHHINGDRSDNRLENLELWSVSQPSGQRIEDKVEWAIELLKTYRPEMLAVEMDVTL